ncbi:MAG: hypothetical protein JRJ19_12500 [Deltaproteobacteria bacterium]|nr:hypothetical protein [Deltaproteobacteria bacterium]
MKRIVILVIAVAFVFGAGFVIANQPSSDVDVVQLDLKRCSTSSDCPNSKCSSGKCGSCSTSSDCKFGKCSSGNCGSCSTSSDCGGWGKCSSGKCGSCSTSSDCGSFGSCSGGKCGKSPY